MCFRRNGSYIIVEGLLAITLVDYIDAGSGRMLRISSVELGLLGGGEGLVQGHTSSCSRGMFAYAIIRL